MSLIKHEIPQPVSHFNMHDDPLTNIETLHLVIWNKGLCIAGYDVEANVLTTKIYSYNTWDISTIEAIFVNEPLVAGPQPVTHIWIVEERTLLIPQHLYEQQAAAEWLRSFHFIGADEEIKATTVENAVNITIVYPLQERLQALLHKYFAEGKIDALSGIILCQPGIAEGSHVDIVYLGNKVILTIKNNGDLLSHQIKEVEHINNLVYAIALICQEYDLKQEDLHVSVSGLALPGDAITELQSFFPKLDASSSEQTLSFTLLNKLISCVS